MSAGAVARQYPGVTRAQIKHHYDVHVRLMPPPVQTTAASEQDTPVAGLDDLPTPCPVCVHPRLELIDELLIAGCGLVAVAQVAGRGVTAKHLRKHRRECLAGEQPPVETVSYHKKARLLAEVIERLAGRMIEREPRFSLFDAMAACRLAESELRILAVGEARVGYPRRQDFHRQGGVVLGGDDRSSVYSIF
jgi:hypothetical protein